MAETALEIVSSSSPPSSSASSAQISAAEQVLFNPSLFSNILHYIEDPLDLDAVCRTSRLLKEAVDAYVRKISCRNSKKLQQLLERFQRITSISLGLALSVCPWLLVTDGDLQFITERLPGLLQLNIELPFDSHQTITNKGLEALGELKMLEQLHLKGLRQVGDGGLIALGKGCTRLRELSLSRIGRLHSSLDLDEGNVRDRQEFISHRGFSALIGGSLIGLETLVLDNCTFLDESCVGMILNCPSLTSLTLLGKMRFTLAELGQGKPECTRLRHLEVGLKSGSDWTNVDLLLDTLARNCIALEDVKLRGRGFSRRGLLSLSLCSSLKILTLEDETRSIEADLAEVLSVNTQLTSLDLTSWPQIFSLVGDAAIMAIASKAPNMRSLSLRSDRITDFALESLAYCSKMTALHLSSCSITNKGLSALAGRCRNLEKVSLAWSRAVGDAGLQMLTASCMNLRNLNISHCSGFTSSGLSTIATCSALETLDLSYTNIDDSSLVAIVRGLPSLRHLSLVKCVLLMGMCAPAMVPTLESLIMGGCTAVSDEGVMSVSKGCPLLRHLGLPFTRVADDGVEALANCSRLQSLDLAFCSEVKGHGLLPVVEACGWLQEIRLSLGYVPESTLQNISTLLEGRACRISVLPRVEGSLENVYSVL